MKKLISIILICLMIIAAFAGCGNSAPEPEHNTTAAIGNPWREWATIAEAEDAVGFPFGLPHVIADSYEATEFRSMNKELIEVVYLDGEYEVCVRKLLGEGEDISGDYNQYESCTETRQSGAAITTYRNNGGAVKQLISHNGHSWSLVAEKGFWGDSANDFLNAILAQ